MKYLISISVADGSVFYAAFITDCECVNKRDLTSQSIHSLIDHFRLQRRVFTGKRLDWYYQPTRRHLGFWNLKILTVGRLKSAEVRRHAKFGLNRSNLGRVMPIFRFFKMAAPAILDFQNFKFLMVVWLKRVEMRGRAKFGLNWSNRSRNFAIFRFFKMAAPPSWVFKIWKF